MSFGMGYGNAPTGRAPPPPSGPPPPRRDDRDRGDRRDNQDSRRGAAGGAPPPLPPGSRPPPPPAGPPPPRRDGPRDRDYPRRSSPPRHGGGDGYGYAGGFGGSDPFGFGGGGGGDRMGGLGSSLRDVDYRNERDVVEVKKNFYNMAKTVEERGEQEVREWRAENKISVSGRAVPNPVLSFDETNFPSSILDSFKRQGFAGPTMIQAQGWTAALSGRDLVGIAKTGSGKTLAFGVPALIHIEAQPRLRRGDGPIALVLAPTRELAVQIEEEMVKVMPRTVSSVCCYGGAPKGPQQRKLRMGTEVVIATPGRLIDFLEGNDTNLKRVTFLVWGRG